MHGTFLNGSRINTHTLTELNDGDELIFGAEVRRGTEVFPACAFRVSYEFGPYKATNSYAFPYMSDNEDAENGGFSDEESENEDISSDEDESVIEVGPRFSQSNHAIDLTRDESPEYVHDSGDAAPAPQMDPVHDVDFEEEAGKPASLDGIDDTHGDEDLDANADEQSEHYSSEDEYVLDGSVCEDNEEGIADEPQFEPLDDDDVDSSVYDYDSDMAASSSQEPPHVRLAEYPSSPTVIKGVERMVMPDDEHNDFGLPKAAEEAMRVMVDNGLLQSNSRTPFYTFAPYHRPSGSSTQLAANSPVIPDTYASISQLSSTSSTGRPSFSNRQPSPSDAAMAKGPEIKDTEIPLSYIRSTANLGQGSGKEEFFQARELNKATLQNQEIGSGRMNEPYEMPVEKPVLPTRLIKACTACNTKRLRDVAVANAVESKVDGEVGSKEATLEVSTAEGSPVFDSLPVDNSMPDLQPQSSFKPAAQPVRSGLRIDEIIEQIPSSKEFLAPKRKADEISTGDEDIRVWASAPAESHAPIPTEVAATFSALLQTSEQPPAKKLRKFMEKVSYAALGGVAVGAALFGSLVATAPDFM